MSLEIGPRHKGGKCFKRRNHMFKTPIKKSQVCLKTARPMWLENRKAREARDPGRLGKVVGTGCEASFPFYATGAAAERPRKRKGNSKEGLKNDPCWFSAYKSKITF